MPAPLFGQPDEVEARRQLRDSVAAYVRKATPSGAGRHGDAARGPDDTQWRQIAELGWIGLQLPEEVGGIGLTHADLAALHHEVGRGALASPLLPVAVLAARPLAHGHNAPLRERLLPGLLNGETLVSLAWQARPGAVSATDIGPTATASGDGWLLEGDARFVPLAPSAQGLVVAARTARGPMLFWVPREAGYTMDTATLADGTEVATTLRLSGVKVPAGDIVAQGAGAADLLADTLDTASLAASAELLGAMERMLEMTITYLNQREQFGQPIGSFQGPQHTAVDVYVQVELARAVLDEAVRVFDSGPAPQARAVAAARAKARCSDAGMFAAKRCIQLHGAIGYTQEYEMSRYVQRVITLAASHGTAANQRRRYAELALSQDVIGAAA